MGGLGGLSSSAASGLKRAWGGAEDALDVPVSMAWKGEAAALPP